MALTAIRAPVGVDPDLAAPAYEVIVRPVATHEQIERLQRWIDLEAEHPLPPHASRAMRRVWLALLAAPEPLSSRDLAGVLQRHRGNIDRALTRLRDDGLVHSDRGFHEARPKNCRR